MWSFPHHLVAFFLKPRSPQNIIYSTSSILWKHPSARVHCELQWHIVSDVSLIQTAKVLLRSPWLDELGHTRSKHQGFNRQNSWETTMINASISDITSNLNNYRVLQALWKPLLKLSVCAFGATCEKSSRNVWGRLVYTQISPQQFYHV